MGRTNRRAYILSNCVASIRSYYNQFQSAGSYLVSGLANGISANTSTVRNASAAVASSAASAARNRLQIKSPSRVGYKIGDYFGIGFTNGITDNIRNAGISSDALAESATNGLSNTESDVVYIYAKAGTGVSSFDLTIGGSVYTVSASDGQISRSITSGTTVKIGNVTPKSGYGSPYNLYYNTESDPYGENGPKQFTSSVTVSGTDFTRRLTVTATESVYAFTTRVLIDDRFVKSTTDNSNTESSVTISSLPLYEQYADSYDFSYALVDEESIERPAYWRVPLRTDSTRVISLYFTTPKRAVTPSIISISLTAHEATINWSKQGATEGQWILYYGTSTSQMSSILITSSPCSVSDLSAAQTYLFRIRHYISSSDHADSDYVSGDTKYDIPSFSWTTDDAANIVAEQPVTKLTAAAWNQLKSLITQCGGNSDSVPTAYSGSPITANAFNAMRNSIASLTGAGDVTPSVTANTTRVEASKFANAYSALKEAINRAITAKNS